MADGEIEFGASDAIVRARLQARVAATRAAFRRAEHFGTIDDIEHAYERRIAAEIMLWRQTS